MLTVRIDADHLFKTMLKAALRTYGKRANVTGIAIIKTITMMSRPLVLKARGNKAKNTRQDGRNIALQKQRSVAQV